MRPAKRFVDRRLDEFRGDSAEIQALQRRRAGARRPSNESYEPFFSKIISAFLADCFSLRLARATSPRGVGSGEGESNSRSGRSPCAPVERAGAPTEAVRAHG